MFQRLISRILPTGQEASSQQEQQQSHEMSNVHRIMDMGFSEEQALNALLICQNNVPQALEYLLPSLVAVAPSSTAVQPLSSHTTTSKTSATEVADYSEEDEQLHRALQESMLIEQNPSSSKAEQNHHRVKKVGKPGGKTSATSIPMAGNKAGQAALERLERQKQYGLKGGTPTRGINRGKVPLPLSSKSKEEQILRSVNRMSPYPKAVDTMLQAMWRLQQEDSSSTVRHSKFRQIDKSSPGYQQALEGVPGVTDLFLVLNFELVSNKWNLPSHRAVDRALLWLVTSSLEQVRATNPDYRKAKQKMEFIKHVQQILQNATADETCQEQEELRTRAVHKNLCPSEPAEGTLHTIILSIVLATNHSKKKQEEEYDIIHSKTAGTSTTKTILSRRFHSDDTVRDLLHWLGGHASIIPTNLRRREWCLRDKNRYPAHPISCTEEADLNKTLQSVGCFPAGLLELDLSDDEWNNNGVSAF